MATISPAVLVAVDSNDPYCSNSCLMAKMAVMAQMAKLAIIVVLAIRAPRAIMALNWPS